jgi:hypothetical protein
VYTKELLLPKIIEKNKGKIRNTSTKIYFCNPGKIYLYQQLLHTSGKPFYRAAELAKYEQCGLPKLIQKKIDQEKPLSD